MKLFTYSTRSLRTSDQRMITISKRAIVHQFRLINDKNQVKLLGTALFRSEKSDKSTFHFGKDARQPLYDLGTQHHATDIQYLHDNTWVTITE